MTPKPDPIDQHLENAYAAGRFVESGTISIDAQKALEKFGRFGLAQPGFWVLKIVQAAVACGAPEIDFKFLRKKVVITFENTMAWQAREILVVVSEGKSGPTRALRHLTAGLAAATGDANKCVTWACGDQEIVFSSTEVKENPNQQPRLVRITAHRSERDSSLYQCLEAPLRHVVRQTIEEYKALIDRCDRCPIPLFLDGREHPVRYARAVEDLPKVRALQESKRKQNLLAVVPFTTGADRKGLTYPIDQLATQSEQDEGVFCTQFFRPESDQVHGVLCVLDAYTRASELVYLHDGVLLQSVNLLDEEKPNSLRYGLQQVLIHQGYRFCLSLCVEANEKDIDFSHFQVRHHQLDEWCLSCIPLLKMVFERLKEKHTLPWKFKSKLSHREPFFRDVSVVDLSKVVFFTAVSKGLLPLGLLFICGMAKAQEKLQSASENKHRDGRTEWFESRLEHALDGLVRLENRYGNPKLV